MGKPTWGKWANNYDSAQLEQLERLRSEDTPATSWLPILLSHIGSQVKRRQSQSYKFKEFTKIENCWILKHYTRHTFWSCLIRCANMKWNRREFLKIQRGHDSVHRRTDGRTDGQGETSISPFQLRWSGGYNYKSRQVHKTLNGLNPSHIFRDMRSAKFGPDLWQIWQVFGPWACPYGSNGQMTMTVHNYRPRQFHRTFNHENPSSSYRDMGSASLADARPPARTVTIPLQPGGLGGKKGFWLAAHNREAPEFNTLEQRLYKQGVILQKTSLILSNF